MLAAETKLPDSVLLEVDDLKDADSLITKIAEVKGDPLAKEEEDPLAKPEGKKNRDPLSQYIRQQMSASNRDLLDNYFTQKAKKDKSKEYKEAQKELKQIKGILVQELNKHIKGENLFEEKRFAHVKLDKKTRGMISQELEGKKLQYLNRLLLEQAYPKAIAKINALMLAKQGIESYKNNEVDDAVEKFNLFLLQQPSDKQALKLRKMAGRDMIIEMLMKGGEVSRIARAILLYAEKAPIRPEREGETIQAAVEKVAIGSVYQRHEAMTLLETQVGSLAIPYMLPYLAKKDTAQRVKILSLPLYEWEEMQLFL